jgi:hypothetical protein
MSDRDEIDDDADWFGKNHAKKVDRILKRALQRARERGLKAAEAAGGPNVFRDTMAAARSSYVRTLKKAIVKQAATTQKSVRVETGRGRNFHLRIDTLKPNPDGKSAGGKAAASNQYIERENAVEIGEVDLWATVDRQKGLSTNRKVRSQGDALSVACEAARQSADRKALYRVNRRRYPPTIRDTGFSS